MYPISHSPGGGYNELLDQSYWYDEMYQKLLPEEMPFECHQLPGDIVFVPEGFYHATINCGQSIGIAALVPDVMKGHDTNQMEEAGPITNLANAMSAHSAGNKELSLLLLQKAHRQAPKNDVIAYYLGVRYVELDNLEDGIPMLKKSLRLNPLRVAAYRDLAIARFRDGFPNRALKSLQVGISHCPEFPTETCIDLYKMAADLYARNGNQRKFNEMKSIADEMESKFGRIPKQGPQQFPLEFI
jgi:tetratricopeptide (TPR) repeat protein